MLHVWGCAADAELDVAELVNDFLRRNREYQAVALLFDELDQYAVTAGEPPLGRVLFNHLETARKALDERLMIVAAGGRGVFALRDLLGSPFLSRATKIVLQPFSVIEIALLGRPFAESGERLDDEILDAVFLSSGGHPALVTYGLEVLWDAPAPSVATVGALYGRFADEHFEFLRDCWRAINGGSTDGLAARVLSVVQSHPGAVPRSSLPAATEGEFGVIDAFELLEAAGLIAVEGSKSADPVVARPIASLLSRPTGAVTRDSLTEQLDADLVKVLQWLHAAAGSLFHTPHDGAGKRLVPENCLATAIAIGLLGLGWTVLCETLQAAGRSDLRATHPRHPGAAIIEAKIWQHKGYDVVQQQVEGYRTHDVGALAVVMLADRLPADWKMEYQSRCIGSRSMQQEKDLVGIEARLTASPVVPNSLPVRHYLVHLPR